MIRQLIIKILFRKDVQTMVQRWQCHRLATIADIQHKDEQGGKV